MFEIWHKFLYVPLLNFLVFLYNGPAFGHLGLAIIYLTILIRFVLLPFTFFSERGKLFYTKLNHKIQTIERDFKNDPVLKREMIREALKEHKVSPWMGVTVLAVQALILVLLYQVFIGGINGKLNELYPWVKTPEFINTNFLGFDLGKRSAFWSGLVGIILFLEIHFDQRSRKNLLTRSDLLYKIFFPFFSFLILWFLPAAKSLFILTSIIFSFIVVAIRQRIQIKIKVEDNELKIGLKKASQ